MQSHFKSSSYSKLIESTSKSKLAFSNTESGNLLKTINQFLASQIDQKISNQAFRWCSPVIIRSSPVHSAQPLVLAFELSSPLSLVPNKQSINHTLWCQRLHDYGKTWKNTIYNGSTHVISMAVASIALLVITRG